MEFGPDDIEVVDDPVKVIRRNPILYGGQLPRGARLAAALIRDLINQGDVPVQIESLDGWWLIVCQKDWLEPERTQGKNYWTRMVPTPEVAVESIRSEVVLAALCRNLFTANASGIECIQRSEDLPPAMKSRVDQILEIGVAGRIVGFLCE
jgi:hypothetical protein